MANKTYLVELTPIGNYFFGSETTFNATDKAAGDMISNYLVRSRMFPQQSTLLGLMRYIILLTEEGFNKPADIKKEMIGESSFQGDEVGAPTSWGKIVSISPLFIKKDNNKYVIAGQDRQVYTESKNLIPKIRPNAASSFSNEFYSFQNLDAKKPAQLLWRNTADNNDLLNAEKVFIESYQIGIKKSFEGKSEDDAFYKQYFYKMVKGFRFAFYLTTKVDLINCSEPFIVPFGADQSLFQVKIKEEQDTIFCNNRPIEGRCRITFLSDVFCKPSILNYCYAAITNSIDFRYIKTNVKTSRFYNMGKGALDMQKSAKLNLLERGSVLYTDKSDELLKELESHKSYLNVGFNHCSIESLN